MHSRRQPQLDRCIQSASAWEESGQAPFSVQTLVLRHCCWINAAVELQELNLEAVQQAAAAVAENKTEKDRGDVDRGGNERSSGIWGAVDADYKRSLSKLVCCVAFSQVTIWQWIDDQMTVCSITKRVCKYRATRRAETASVAATRTVLSQQEWNSLLISVQRSLFYFNTNIYSEPL